MSGWVAGSIAVGSVVGAGASIYAGGKASEATDRATDASVSGQREQLDYLKDVDRLPREYREKALAQLSDTYLGPEGFQYPEGRLLDQAKNSELFAMLNKEGDDAVLRNASATGGLRSGGTNEALADNQQRALMTSYLEQQKQYEMGLQGTASLAGTPLQTTNIANTMGNIATTQAQGIATQGQIAQNTIQGVGDAIGTGVGQFAYAKGKGII